MLFFTGTARNSATILKDQQRATARRQSPTLGRLHRIKAAAHACRRCLEQGDLDGVGALLDEGWRHKRALVAGITDTRIDRIYDAAVDNGAIGGKITGAGGGGFLLLYCHEEKQQAVVLAMEEFGLRRMNFHLEPDGVAVSALQWATMPGVASPAPAAIA